MRFPAGFHSYHVLLFSGSWGVVDAVIFGVEVEYGVPHSDDLLGLDSFDFSSV